MGEKALVVGQGETTSLEMPESYGWCTYVGSHGRCESTSRLEFHHIVPFAAGGEPTIDNTALVCRVHNNHEAERFFGIDQERYHRVGTGTASEQKLTRSGTRKKLPPCG